MSEREPRPRHALNVALARVVVCVLLAGSSEVLEAPRWAEQGRLVRAPPAGLAWLLSLLDAGESWVPATRVLCVAAALLAAFGWRPRLTLALAAASGTLLFALPHLSGSPRHSMHVVWLALLLAFSPVGLGLSWGSSGPSSKSEPLELRVALAAAWGLLAAVYFFPGFWKLRESGLDWIVSDNLRNQMYWKWYQAGALPAWRIDRHPGLVQLGALGVVAFELGFPLLLWRRGSRLVAAAVGVAFHWAADVFLFLPFTALVAAYVVLVDWEWLARWLRDEPLPDPSRSLAAGWHELVAGLRESARLRALTAAALVLLAGAFGAGALGVMRAYPFACYPTFQWRAGTQMPDLWIELAGAGAPRWVAEGPAHGGARAQARWGVAWRAAGVYGEAVTLERLVAYYRTLSPGLSAQRRPGERVRFYRALVDVRPEARGAPPASLALLAEWSPDDAATAPDAQRAPAR